MSYHAEKQELLQVRQRLAWGKKLIIVGGVVQYTGHLLLYLNQHDWFALEPQSTQILMGAMLLGGLLAAYGFFRNQQMSNAGGDALDDWFVWRAAGTQSRMVIVFMLGGLFITPYICLITIPAAWMKGDLQMLNIDKALEVVEKIHRRNVAAGREAETA